MHQCASTASHPEPAVELLTATTHSDLSIPGRTHMTALRHWENDVGWVSDAPPRRCQVCGVVVARRPGMGGPFRNCPDHAPANRAAAAKWYGKHREERRDYNRQRNGSQPLETGVCADCGKPYQTRIGSPCCSACRPGAKRAELWRARVEATMPRICPECQRSFPSQPIGGSPQIFCSPKCRDRNHERTRPKRAPR